MASWSRDAVIYEVYVRSFADGDADGVGDLRGAMSRLEYLADLGVDAVWLTPFYRSPMADGGYDVADYRDVDPILGTLADLYALVARAHEVGLRVLIDIVPNHCSVQHPWFQAALRAGPGTPERELFHIRPGRGEAGEEPPNNWMSVFSGPAWDRLSDGEWYLHLFAPEQPDLNWEHPRVRAEFADILRFWLDRGIDGIRIDVASALVKAPGLPDRTDGGESPSDDQEGVHEIYRQWRSILDSYQPERVSVAEAWLFDMRRLARYVRPDELHQAFNFAFLTTPWSGPDLRRIIDESLTAMGEVGAPATWVLANHDVVRTASRLAAGLGAAAGGAGSATDPAALAGPDLGLRRARAAALLMLALPGSAYLYQGEELGLAEVYDLPAEARQDPIFARTGGTLLGRDGCRVPLPWSGTDPPYGFGPPGSRPWLPQPESWGALSVQAQADDPGSTLALYRGALRLRRALLQGIDELQWISAADADVLVFDRGPLRCAVNLGSSTVQAPPGEVALASWPVPPGDLPPDCALWIRA
jgi:alpha-glucosidase